jgi:hypothetical protein
MRPSLFRLAVGSIRFGYDEPPPDDVVVIDEKDLHHSEALRRCCRDGRFTAHNTFCGSQINTDHALPCSSIESAFFAR